MPRERLGVFWGQPLRGRILDDNPAQRAAALTCAGGAEPVAAVGGGGRAIARKGGEDGGFGTFL